MESALTNDFYQMIQPFVQHFRAQVAPTFLALALAWAATPRQGRTSQLLHTLGPNRASHPTTYYRFFSASNWCADLLAIGLFNLCLLFFGLKLTIRIIFDDTLLKKTGPRVFGASMFRDAVLSTQSKVVTRWGLNWVVMVLALPHPVLPGELIPIPLMARLFLTKESCEATGSTYKSPTQLSVEMFRKLHLCSPPTLQWRLIADGAYTNEHILSLLPDNVQYTGTMRCDSCLQGDVNDREYKGKGRYPIYGLDLPKPHQMLNDPDIARTEFEFVGYGGRIIKREVVEYKGTYKKIAGTRKLRFVLVAPKKSRDKALYLLTTDLECEVVVVLEDFVSRWCVEVCFREAKQQMGVEKSQVFTEDAVRRQTPFGLWVMGMVKVWYLKNAEKIPNVRLDASWYQPGERVSFAQMQAAFRYIMWTTLMEEGAETKDIFSGFGYPEDCQERQRLILRLFFGC